MIRIAAWKLGKSGVRTTANQLRLRDWNCSCNTVFKMPEPVQHSELSLAIGIQEKWNRASDAQLVQLPEPAKMVYKQV